MIVRLFRTDPLPIIIFIRNTKSLIQSNGIEGKIAAKKLHSRNAKFLLPIYKLSFSKLVKISLNFLAHVIYNPASRIDRSLDIYPGGTGLFSSIEKKSLPFFPSKKRKRERERVKRRSSNARRGFAIRKKSGNPKRQTGRGADLMDTDCHRDGLRRRSQSASRHVTSG